MMVIGHFANKFPYKKKKRNEEEDDPKKKNQIQTEVEEL